MNHDHQNSIWDNCEGRKTRWSYLDDSTDYSSYERGEYYEEVSVRCWKPDGVWNCVVSLPSSQRGTVEWYMQGVLDAHYAILDEQEGSC